MVRQACHRFWKITEKPGDLLDRMTLQQTLYFLLLSKAKLHLFSKKLAEIGSVEEYKNEIDDFFKKDGLT